MRPTRAADPIGDDALSPVAGIVHRYPDRVLLKVVVHLRGLLPVLLPPRDGGAGAVGGPDAGELDAALAYIAAHPAIWEVILTGGDPLMLSPRRLGRDRRQLAAIDHVKVVRFHTRVPVVAPERITPTLVAAMRPRQAT